MLNQYLTKQLLTERCKCKTTSKEEPAQPEIQLTQIYETDTLKVLLDTVDENEGIYNILIDDGNGNRKVGTCYKLPDGTFISRSDNSDVEFEDKNKKESVLGMLSKEGLV